MIDFSTLQGLTIPEGAVTQITDASGMVLWKLATGGNAYYLRPIADISVDSTITLTPTDATAAYMLINEEVSDGGSTTIGVAASEDATSVSGTATFRLGGYVPENIGRILDFNVAVSGDTLGSTVTVNGMPTNGSHIGVNLHLNGTEISCDFQADAVSDLFQGASFDVLKPNGFSRLETNGSFKEVSKDVLLAEINDYISANGVLPNMELEIWLSARRVTTTDSGGKSSTLDGYAEVSQAYIVLEYE